MKNYLLIAGDHYYPQSGTDDWIGCFETEAEAQQKIVIEKKDVLFLSGPRKGQVKEIREEYYVNGRQIGWYEIVDLVEWMKRESK